MLTALLCCCNPPPVCCVLPPKVITLTSYAWSGYDLQYGDGDYDYAGRRTITDLSAYILAHPTSPFSDGCGLVYRATGLDTYRYFNPEEIPEGADPGQTQRLLLVITCNSAPFFCVNGVMYESAALFSADENWNPTSEVAAWNLDAICQPMLIPYFASNPDEEWYYWQAPEDNLHMDSVFIESCPDAIGSVRVEATSCLEGNVQFEFPLYAGYTLGDTYLINICGSPGAASCYTLTSEIENMPGMGAGSVTDTSGCVDALCL